MATKVTVLGIGLMGAGMARSMLREGLDVTVWNRSADKARPLHEHGASVVEDADPAAAVADADLVVTMLFDAPATEAVMRQALPAMRADAVWIQCATIGIEASSRMAALAHEHDVAFADAPVLGTRQPAEQGKLAVLVGGPEALKPKVSPVFDAIGARTIWVGERPGDGHRLKLVANAWTLTLTAAAGQSIALAESLGLEPQQFLDTIAGGLMDSQYAQNKGRAMISGDFAPAFAVSGAVKDTALIADAMREAGVDDRLMRTVNAEFEAIVKAGHGDDDMGAVVHAFR